MIEAPDVRAVYIDTLGTFNPSLLQSLLSQYATSSSETLDRIHLMTALDMVTLIESCESVRRSLEELVPIDILVIDTIANPLSILMNKGQLQGNLHHRLSILIARPCFDAIIYSPASTYNGSI